MRDIARKLATTIAAIPAYAAIYAVIMGTMPPNVAVEWATAYVGWSVLFLAVVPLTNLWLSDWCAMAVMVGGAFVLLLGVVEMWPYLGRM